MKNLYRFAMYCIGLIILALGIVLNTKTGYGVSPIISIPYSISQIWNLNLGNTTLCFYIIYVIGQILVLGKKYKIYQLLQIPMSVIFSRLLNVFNDVIHIDWNSPISNILLLIVAVILTGIGAAMSVDVKIVPNAADGFVQAIGERTEKDFGFIKNIFDASCVVITILIGFVFSGKIVGIGLGTLVTALGVGRVIALFNKLFKDKLAMHSGIVQVSMLSEKE